MLVVKRVGVVVGWEVIGWVVGVGGTVVVTDTLSTDRQTGNRQITHKYYKYCKTVTVQDEHCRV